jgi:imidazolonepropionase-like amidohydrolase
MYTVLKNATLIDGTDRAPLNHSVLIFNETKIIDIGTAKEVTIPENSRVYDVSGFFVIPGLIDCHIHLDLHGMADTFQENLVEDKLRAIRSAKEMEDTLRAGYTTVRSLGSVNGIDFSVRQAIDEGLVKGPRILTSGRIICMTCSGTEYFKGMYRIADGVDENRKAAREQLKDGADVLKVMATGAIMNPGGVPGAAQLGVGEMRAVVEEGAKLGIATAAHAHGAQGIKNAIEAGVATIEHGTMADNEAIEMMVKKNVFLVPTLLVDDLIRRAGEKNEVPAFMVEKAERIKEMRHLVLEKAMSAGVKIAMGTDAGTPFNFHGKNSIELDLYVSENLMTPLKALQTATKNAAEAIGLSDRLGTLEKDKMADCVVLKKNPLEDMSCLMDLKNIYMVFKAGILQRGWSENDPESSD